jgi:hypothetical protein
MDDKTKRMIEFSAKLNTLILKIRDKAFDCFIYNESTNLPKGIMAADEIVSKAILYGTASAINTIGEWDCDNAIGWAVEILEDANCHGEAAALLAASKES